jgi:DNA-binding transcriptional regulator YhcF (GntR family)
MDIELDRGSAVPIAAQLEERLTWLIATRTLRPGDRLPSIRQLGTALGIHHHTVRQAYRDMEARDLVSTRQGAGTTVKGLTSLLQARPRYAGAMPAQGVLIADYTSFYLPLLRGIELGGAETHTLTIHAVAEDSQVKANLQMHQLITAGVRGLIVASVGQLVRQGSRHRARTQQYPSCIAIGRRRSRSPSSSTLPAPRPRWPSIWPNTAIGGSRL